MSFVWCVCSKERFYAICANVVTRTKRMYKVDVQLRKGKKFEPGYRAQAGPTLSLQFSLASK